MANGRLFLVCSKCGEKVLLYKWWVSRLEDWITSEAQMDFVRWHLTDCYEFPNTLADTPEGPLFRLEGE